MARRAIDSTPVKMWMKNIWMRQTSKIISLHLNYLPSILGMVAVDSPKSMVASIGGKQNIAWWMLCSVWMTNKVVKLPMSVIRYTAQKGKPIQMWMFFTPGIPSNRKEERWNWVPLERGIFLVISYNVFIANVCWSMSGGSSLLPWCLPVLERSNYLFVPVAKKTSSVNFFVVVVFLPDWLKSSTLRKLIIGI